LRPPVLSAGIHGIEKRQRQRGADPAQEVLRGSELIGLSSSETARSTMFSTTDDQR
jgi:hypothetical protein